ncbi:uncharacterized protein [Oryctolagus cuniculus]|uniref:uncharacterized protein isoform X2 n=1 Tax=Oryctolagus cuniculus TaxID=9986 RepID=UPI003879A25F
MKPLQAMWQHRNIPSGAAIWDCPHVPWMRTIHKVFRTWRTSMKIRNWKPTNWSPEVERLPSSLTWRVERNGYSGSTQTSSAAQKSAVWSPWTQRSWSFPHHQKLEPHRRRHNSSHGPPHQSSASSDIKSSPSTSWFSYGFV